MPNPGFTLEDVWDRIDRRADDECWPWLGALDGAGYGRFRAQRRSHKAYRVAYELTHGPVPDGLVLDHLCRRVDCCNPSHLEPVTDQENFWRSPLFNGNKTECPSGHPYDEANTKMRRGRRYCRTCERASQKVKRQRKRAAFVVQGLTTKGTPRIRSVGCPGPRKLIDGSGL